MAVGRQNSTKHFTCKYELKAIVRRRKEGQRVPCLPIFNNYATSVCRWYDHVTCVVSSGLTSFYCSFLGNEGEPEHCELMFQVKDYCFAREDRIVGVGLLQLSNIVEQESCACWVQLGRRFHIDETGLILLRCVTFYFYQNFLPLDGVSKFFKIIHFYSDIPLLCTYFTKFA